MESQLTAVLRKSPGNVKNKDMILSKFLNKLPSVPYGKDDINKLSFKRKKNAYISMLLNLLAEA